MYNPIISNRAHTVVSWPGYHPNTEPFRTPPKRQFQPPNPIRQFQPPHHWRQIVTTPRQFASTPLPDNNLGNKIVPFDQLPAYAEDNEAIANRRTIAEINWMDAVRRMGKVEKQVTNHITSSGFSWPQTATSSNSPWATSTPVSTAGQERKFVTVPDPFKEIEVGGTPVSTAGREHKSSSPASESDSVGFFLTPTNSPAKLDITTTETKQET